MFCSVFFFFKQKTAYEMRISDWSSDVCSSDLTVHAAPGPRGIMRHQFLPRRPVADIVERFFGNMVGETFVAYAVAEPGEVEQRIGDRGAPSRSARSAGTADRRRRARWVCRRRRG